MSNRFDQDVLAGKRFEFGENWKSFLDTLDDSRIETAVDSLRIMLKKDSLKGQKFLDIGSGSGLFSLGAALLGAEVVSVDFDPSSIWCTQELKKKYLPNSTWQVFEGSILDTNFIENLGAFDIVYSWGVLHHTGDLKKALKNSFLPLKTNSTLFIGIYNDQGLKSRYWTFVKKLYNYNLGMKLTIKVCFISFFLVRFCLVSLIKLKNPLKRYERYKQNRGMSLYHDWIDWIGGYPFEVARPSTVVDFCTENGMLLSKINTTCNWGINEFVFQKVK